MFTINMDKQPVKKEAAELPLTITIRSKSSAAAPLPPVAQAASHPQPVNHRQLTARQKEQTPLAQQCWHEFNQLRIEQAKLSNTIYDTVKRGASLAELKDLYARIEGYRPDLIALYEKARHVEQYGVLPEVKEVAEPQDLASLKLKRKALIDLRCKLQVKLRKGHLKESKVLDWRMQLDIANAEYAELDERIKRMEGKA